MKNKYEIITGILRMLTVISYLLIPVHGEHIGGPFILFLILGLGAKDTGIIVLTILILTSLFLLVFIALRQKPSIDKVVLPIISVFLTLPFITFYRESLHTFDLKNISSTTVSFITFASLNVAINVMAFKRR